MSKALAIIVTYCVVATSVIVGLLFGFYARPDAFVIAFAGSVAIIAATFAVLAGAAGMYRPCVVGTCIASVAFAGVAGSIAVDDGSIAVVTVSVAALAIAGAIGESLCTHGVQRGK